MRNKLSSKRRLLPVVLAAGALLMAATLPTEAGAAVKSSFPIVGSLYCKGTLAGSLLPAEVPDGDFLILGAFAGTPKPKKIPKGFVFNVAPTTLDPDGKTCSSAKGGCPVQVTLGIYTDATCTSLNQNQALATSAQDPCGQAVYGLGTYTIEKKAKTGTLVLGPFGLAPSINAYLPAPSGSDPFSNNDGSAGCTWTFTVTPDTHSNKSTMAFTGQTGCPAGTVGGSITNFNCQVNNSCNKSDSSSC